MSITGTCTSLTAADATSPQPSRPPLSFHSHGESDLAKSRVGEESMVFPVDYRSPSGLPWREK